MQSTYWLEKVLKIILYVNALLCTLQHKQDSYAFALLLVALDKQVLHILSVCTLSCPACNAHAQCYVICGLSGCTTFYHILIKSTIFNNNKKLLNTKCNVM